MEKECYWGVITFGLLYLFVKFWPIYSDRPFDQAVHIYWKVKILNEPLKISSIFADSDTICMQGADETLHHTKYHQFILKKSIEENQKYFDQIFLWLIAKLHV